MAAILNDRDIALQASTRTATTNLPINVNVPGNVTGTLNGIPVQDVIDAANQSATEDFFTISSSDPVGGSHKDAHFNSSTNVMWFNINGTWTRGGTVNASQITTGTLAAARIAANSITSDKLFVTSLSALTSNLGTVNAGNISGSANIEINGQAIFNGQVTADGNIWSGIFNLSNLSTCGVLGYAGLGGIGVRGSAAGKGSSSIGVSGSNTTGVGTMGTATSGTGVRAIATTGIALDVQGPMTIDNNILVRNLNAHSLNNKASSSYCQVVLGNTGTCTVSGNGFNLVSTVSGQQVRGNGSNGLIIESTSDRRLKTNIKDETLGLDFINSLKPKTYEMKDRPGFTYHGFIAQDVQLLIDGDQDALFHTNENGIHGSDAISKIPALVKAVQQLTDQIADLNQKLITVSAESVMLKSELGR